MVSERTAAGREAGSLGPSPGADTRRPGLLIEDDDDIAEAIASQIEKVGLHVRVARTGEEGLEAVRKGADLVLLDLTLPGMDGLEVCRMMRRQPTRAHVPIIIVSARTDGWIAPGGRRRRGAPGPPRRELGVGSR